MIRLRASLAKAFMLNLALFSTGLLLLKKLFPEIDQTWHLREVRRAEGFEGHHGDLVLELAKVFTQILILMKVKIMSHFEVVALPPLVGTNISCKPPDLPRRWISSSLVIVALLPMKIFPIKVWPNRPICEGPGFTGELLETPRKIVVLMPFGFEVAYNENNNNWWKTPNVRA